MGPVLDACWRRQPPLRRSAASMPAFTMSANVTDLRSVLALLADDPIADLVHFAAHGRADPSGEQNGIILVDGSTLEPTVVRARSLNGTPFIFLNACELGTGQLVLGAYAGMAHAFLHSGACAVIAPLWSVGDETAKTQALTFYARIFAGALPADVLRDLRSGAGGTGPRRGYHRSGLPVLRAPRNDLAAPVGAENLCRPPGRAAGLCPDFVLTTGGVPRAPEPPEPSRDLPRES
jgi:CHAT domain